MHENPLLKQAAYVDGDWVTAASGECIEVFNPSTNQSIGNVPSICAKETQYAVSVASKAFSNWRSTTGKERSQVLRRWFDLINQYQNQLAELITLEQGKPLKEAKSEVVYGASFIEWFAEEAKRTNGETLQSHERNLRLSTIKQPIGVAAIITPWNFPCAMITRKAGAALAAGCSVVVKPSELTPFSGLALAALADQAGIPPGVFNVVTGEAETIGQVLTSSETVRKLSFTGSTSVGQLLMRQSAPSIKKLSLELGGNAPFIVMDDANIEKAVDAAIACKFRNAGQTCVSVNRIYVQNSVYDEFVHSLTKRIGRLSVGDGFDDNVDIGPLIDVNAVIKLLTLLDNAVSKGAKIVSGGQPLKPDTQFFAPTVLCDVEPSMSIVSEEIFGPIASVSSFATEDEVIAQANQSELGLSAYLFSENHNRIVRLSERIEAGMIGINTGLISTEVAPFGGVKQSGLGREGGHQGIDEYLETKYLCADIE